MNNSDLFSKVAKGIILVCGTAIIGIFIWIFSHPQEAKTAEAREFYLTDEGCQYTKYYRACRFHDNQKKVTCWVVGERFLCIPDKDLLEQQ